MAGLFPRAGESCSGSCHLQAGGTGPGGGPRVGRYLICKGTAPPAEGMKWSKVFGSMLPLDN